MQGFQLVDNDFTVPGIDIILGADVYVLIIEDGCIKGSTDSPIAQRTKLGWIVSGPSGSKYLDTSVQGFHVSINTDLYELLHRFWTLEEIPSPTGSSLTNEEEECERHFSQTHTRDEHGRYIVKLPFKRPAKNLGNSRSRAMQVMKTLTKRLANNSSFSTLYSDFMLEYERLHHMIRIPDGHPEPQHTYYLPHHGVLREHTLTTKLRVVFNGSSRTETGYSLNDLLHTGAKLQTDLFDVLL